MEEILTLLKTNWQAIAVGGGPLTASLVMRLLLGKNKALFMLMNGSAAWLAIRVVLTPHMDFVKQNLTYLIQITNR